MRFDAEVAARAFWTAKVGLLNLAVVRFSRKNSRRRDSRGILTNDAMWVRTGVSPRALIVQDLDGRTAIGSLA
jgi:hypothetical protein